MNQFIEDLLRTAIARFVWHDSKRLGQRPSLATELAWACSVLYPTADL